MLPGHASTRVVALDRSQDQTAPRAHEYKHSQIVAG